MRTLGDLSAILLIILACTASSLAGTKCKYSVKVSRLQVSGSGVVAWSLAKRPASCVDHFQVCWGPVGVSPTCTKAPSSSRSLELEGLQPCRWHNVSVSALGDVAASPVHVASLLHFSDPGDQGPSVIKKPKMILVQPNRVVVSINDTESSDRRCFSHYTICWSAMGAEETCKRKKSFETMMEAGRLQLCAIYTFKLWSSLLDRANSTPASFILYTGVGDVRDVTITTVTSSAIGVRWQPPSAEGDCVDRYKITYDSGSAEVMANTTEYLVPDLLPCKHYFVEVHAISAHGTWSNTIRRRAVTRPSVPGVVRDLRVHWTTSRRLLVRWKAPEDTKFCHVRYSLCWRKNGVDNERCARHKLSPYPSHTIGKLKPCTEYTVKVAVLGAEKVLGNATAIRATTGPEPVANLRVERTPDGQRELLWETPVCAESYLVCWGAWGNGGKYSCAETTDNSFAVNKDELRHDNLTYSVVAVGTRGAFSDRALVHLEF